MPHICSSCLSMNVPGISQVGHCRLCCHFDLLAWHNKTFDLPMLGTLVLWDPWHLHSLLHLQQPISCFLYTLCPFWFGRDGLYQWLMNQAGIWILVCRLNLGMYSVILFVVPQASSVWVGSIDIGDNIGSIPLCCW